MIEMELILKYLLLLNIMEKDCEYKIINKVLSKVYVNLESTLT